MDEVFWKSAKLSLELSMSLNSQLLKCLMAMNQLTAALVVSQHNVSLGTLCLSAY